MSLLDQIGGVLSSALAGNAGEQTAHQHFDTIAGNTPQNVLGAAIGPALANLNPLEVQQKVTDTAAQMSPDQRGNIIQTLLNGLSGSAGGLGNLTGLLSQLGIDSSILTNPQSASADDVGKLAAHAQLNAPDVFHEAMSFYSAHPTLVKALGTVVLAGIARHLAK